jgi:hypothetical protein
MNLEENQESREPERLVYPGQRDRYHRQRLIRDTTTEGAGIGTEGTQEDMKADAIIATLLGTRSGKNELTIEERTETPTQTETGI